MDETRTIGFTTETDEPSNELAVVDTDCCDDEEDGDLASTVAGLASLAVTSFGLGLVAKTAIQRYRIGRRAKKLAAAAAAHPGFNATWDPKTKAIILTPIEKVETEIVEKDEEKPTK